VKGYAIFEIYLAKNWKDIEAGREIVCEVQSFGDGSCHVVRAQIAPSAERLPDGEELRIRTEDGEYKKEVWRIRISEELDADEVDLGIPPPITLRIPPYGPGR